MAVQRFPHLAHWGAFTAVVEDGRFVRAEPFAGDEHPSPLLDSMPAMTYSKLRIARPAVREGWLKSRARTGRGAERFIEVPWDEALDLVAGELARVRGEHGAKGIFGGSYGWSSAGRLHHARTLVRRFLFAGGGAVDQQGNYSWGCAQFFLPHIVGSYESVSGKSTHWSSLVEHTDVFFALGGFALKNAQVGSGGVGNHDLVEWLRAMKNRGCRFEVVSPNAGDAPAFLGARWTPIVPNTDTAFLLAIAHELIVGGHVDRDFVDRCTVGYDEFARYVLGRTDGIAKTPAWAADICGVPAAHIAALAASLPGKRVMFTSVWSVQRAQHGEQPYWMLVTLAAMLGQIGLPGGGFGFGHGSIHGVANPRPEVSAPGMPTGANPADFAIPVARMADMLLHPNEPYDFNGRRETYPDIRLVYWAGGNPFHHHQDLNRLRAAWARPETIVVHDPWWTATAKHADIVLPATTTLERNDVGGGARDRYIIAMHRAIAPVGEARDDFAIFSELARRGGYADKFTEGRDESAWIRWIYENARGSNAKAGITLPDFDAFWAAGVAEQPPPTSTFVAFEAFRRDPAANPLKTPSGRIEITSEAIRGFGYGDCPPHPTWLPPTEYLGAPLAKTRPLHLVTIQPPDRLHGQLDPGPVAVRNKVSGREKIRMHPDDAAARGLVAGDVVRVFNDRGACLAGVEIDVRVIPRVVSMATGAWYDPADGGPQALERHGNPNVLAEDRGTSKLAQGPSALSVLVEVEKFTGTPPASRAHEPPEVVAGG
jgi:biotin/methionine sulfoxide reductase